LGVQQAGAVARAVEEVQPVTFQLGEESIILAPNEVLIESAPLEGYAVAQESGIQVALDTTLTEALRYEGLARDLVRAVQEVRKAAGLTLSDRITLYLSGDEALGSLLAIWGDYLRGETLAANLVVGTLAEDGYTETVGLDGMQVTVGVMRRAG
jgi:isoleucyl-tRNA synthetase